MNEMTKATARRLKDARYSQRWFVGRGLDVGCGPDKMDPGLWPLVTEVDGYDQVLGSGDAQFLSEIESEKYDFVVSSHCLEHLKDPRVAMVNWLRVVRPGGFVVVTIPEELMYESGRWPSRFNSDHKHSFSMRQVPIIPSSINVVNFLWRQSVDVEHLTRLSEHWSKEKLGQDQTLGDAECAIEFVVRKIGGPLAF